MAHAGLWTPDRADGLERTWCCTAGTARDFARIGMLCREGDMWRGEQVEPSNWVEYSPTPASSAERWGGAGEFAALSNYGYQWWLGDPDRGDFAAIGKDGQFLFINPVSGLVVVWLGESLGGVGMDNWVGPFRDMTKAQRPCVAG